MTQFKNKEKQYLTKLFDMKEARGHVKLVTPNPEFF